MLEINFKEFPILSTNRLRLRQINATDAQEIFVLRSDENVMQFIDRPRAQLIDDALQQVKKVNDDFINSNGINWAISLKEDGKLIGTIGFWRIMKEHHRAEIGYMLHKNYQRRGIMQEALTTVLNYGFETMKLHSVEANANPLNNASIKLLEKNGFIKEAYFKENYYSNGVFLDSVIYSLLTPLR